MITTQNMFRILIAVTAVTAIGLLFLWFDNDVREVFVNEVNENANVVGESNVTPNLKSSREIFLAESIRLPLSGSVPSENVKHGIPIDEIRRGCFRQDCIPSVDDPLFIGVEDALSFLPEDTVGIGLIYRGEKRFYPFNMLVTREIVNDIVAGDPLLVTYCPLCGTGIVFERSIDGAEYEFGVSGMLWQSNLLMYNRADSIEDQSLWSQVLGEAVVGKHTGTRLNIIPSNIVRFAEWSREHPDAFVLNTGKIGDPYNGEYYRVARAFAPNFDEASSPIDPSAYVYGIEIEGAFKAYADEALPVGLTKDEVMGTEISIERTDVGEVSIVDGDGNTVPIVTGFWFSWVSAHPETELWQGS